MKLKGQTRVWAIEGVKRVFLYTFLIAVVCQTIDQPLDVLGNLIFSIEMASISGLIYWAAVPLTIFIIDITLKFRD